MPANAKIIRGKGIISGGPPRKIEAGPISDAPCTADEIASLRQEVEDLRVRLRSIRSGGVPSRVVHVTKYSFSDDGLRVKIYVHFDQTLLDFREKTKLPPSLITGTAGIWSHFTASSAEVHVMTMVRKPFWAANDDAVVKHVLKLDMLVHEIIPSKCSCKVVAEKGRLVLSLRKADPKRPWQQVTQTRPPEPPEDPNGDSDD
jgi:hypothetical protein